MYFCAKLLDMQDFQMITSFKQTYIDALKHYYFVGGMPEAVQSFAENKDFNEVQFSNFMCAFIL